ERFDFAPLPPPGTPDTAARRLLAVASAFGIGTTGDPTHFASNNWAVAPSRTRDGLALLAGDPHLDLTLPSIWYEVHLVVPGQLDEYGVSIAGLPGVVLGFTRDVAWSFTNTGADVMDFYRETVDDTLHPTKYRVDGAWLPIEQRVEPYRDPSGNVVHVDTLRFTRRGPLSRRGRDWLSMRWTALEPSHDVQALIAGAEATSARAFLDSLAAYFFVPAQNIIAADRGGTIAIRSTGHIPLRPRGTDGMTIFDGSSSASDWTGFWPVSQYPQAFNPAQGYLASANQQPIDPRVAPAYQGDDRSFEPWRAMQINRLLRADSQVTVDDMRRFQVDPGSERAELFMPYLLGAVRHADSAGHADSTLRAAGRILAAWDMRYTHDNRGAALFEQALRNIRRDLWDELDDGTERRVALPSWDVTLEAMAQPASTWWDDRRTKTVVEDRDAIIARALHAAYDTLARRYGPPRDGGWRWDTVARVPIAHLLGLPGFSDMNLRTSGGIGTLNPAMDGGGAGPSWRMVVQLGPEIRAWATYPGGQSGNPASPWYDNRIPGWLAGQLDTLYLPRDPGGVDAHHLSASLTLAPASAASRRGGH
ncbi:MAG TPA: penicillin acylase family protein, partial [Gemmatimonadaceae bacterium]|nr:penicillin acylase family protein [Gemmatimonadaceae bacterium]